MRTDVLHDRDGDLHMYRCRYSDSKNLHKYVVRHMYDTSRSNFTYIHIHLATRNYLENVFFSSFFFATSAAAELAGAAAVSTSNL